MFFRRKKVSVRRATDTLCHGLILHRREAHGVVWRGESGPRCSPLSADGANGAEGPHRTSTSQAALSFSTRKQFMRL